MHEDILVTVLWLDKAAAFLSLRNFNGSMRHLTPLSDPGIEDAYLRTRLVRLAKDRRLTQDVGRGQVVRPKLDTPKKGATQLAHKDNRQEP
jgi:hypothetical protein